MCIRPNNGLFAYKQLLPECLELFVVYRYTEGVKRKDENMANKTQRLKPDTVLKNYWRNNERFADLFNAV